MPDLKELVFRYDECWYDCGDRIAGIWNSVWNRRVALKKLELNNARLFLGWIVELPEHVMP